MRNVPAQSRNMESTNTSTRATCTPVLNDDGTQQSWISEKVVYEGKIKINEPMFFSLTIPEDTARVCLFMKRPWDVSWFTWPITDQTPFYVSGDTFLTGGS